MGFRLSFLSFPLPYIFMRRRSGSSSAIPPAPSSRQRPGSSSAIPPTSSTRRRPGSSSAVPLHRHPGEGRDPVPLSLYTVIPAKAGIQLRYPSYVVIPAKAGIQLRYPSYVVIPAKAGTQPRYPSYVVIPAKAGIQLRCPSYVVIPAEAGIQCLAASLYIKLVSWRPRTCLCVRATGPLTQRAFHSPAGERVTFSLLAQRESNQREMASEQRL